MSGLLCGVRLCDSLFASKGVSDLDLCVQLPGEPKEAQKQVSDS